MLLLLVLLSSFLTPNDSKTARVVLRIEGLKEVKGEIRIAVFNSRETYAREPFALAVVPVYGKQCEWEVPSLLFGEYAIAVYHDSNVNTKLDTNLVGAPTESYGFSNNARGLFGPPSWEKARIIIDKASQSFSIQLK